MDKISIIIPCYNVEKKIDRCVRSLVRQTIGMENLELIFVDDASTDNTLNKLYEWEEKYQENIILISCSKNGKQGTARNIGMANSTGNYIGFVDSDDWIDEDMYEILYNAIVKFNCDIASIKLQRETENGDVYEIDKREFTYDKRIVIDTVEDRKAFLNTGWPGSLCSKIYCKDFLVNNNIVFPENLIYEDEFFATMIALYLRSYVIIDKKKYHYIANEKSTLSSNGSKHLDRLTIELLKIDEFNKRGFMNTYYDEIERDFVKAFWCKTLQLIFTRFSSIPYEVIDDMKATVLNLFPYYKNNKYIQKFDELNQTLLKMIDVNLSREDINFIAENFRVIWDDAMNQMKIESNG